MGEFVKVKPGEVRTSQDFVKEKTVAYIKKCYELGNLRGLPPSPIVRTAPDGSHIAIDGHNLLVVHDELGKETRVYVAESADDFLEGDEPGVASRNRDLKEKYDSSLVESDRLKSKGIVTIRDLRK